MRNMLAAGHNRRTGKTRLAATRKAKKRLLALVTGVLLVVAVSAVVVTLHISDKGTNILQAARTGNLARVQELLAGNPAAARDRDGEGRTPLHLAAEHGHTDVVGFLLADGADVTAATRYGRTALHWAARNGHTDATDALVRYGADVNAQGLVSRITPIHWASAKGHRDVVGLLLANGADVNAGTRNGMTPLHFAAERDHTDVVVILLQHGANLRLTDVSGKTPLGVALREGNTEVAELLRKQGATE